MSQVTLKDVSIKEYELEDFDRLKRLQELHFQIMPEMCIERSRLVTEYLKKASNSDDPPVLRQAKVLKYLLENKKPIICHTGGKVVRYEDGERSIQNFEFRDDNLLAGTTTSKPKGVLLYPEFLALSMWPELLTVRDRDTNPYYISDEDIERLNFDVFPFWMDRTPLEYVREKFDEPSCQRLMEKLVFFLCSKPYCISHTIPDYWRVVGRGLNDIIREAEEKKSSADAEKSAFYEAMKLVLEGVIAYANNLSDEATRLAASEMDADRKKS